MAEEEQPQILVTGVPESHCSEDLLEEYFSQFGEVIGVAAEDGGVATITFAADVDLQAILEDKHLLDEQPVEVKVVNGVKRRRTGRTWKDTEESGEAAGDGDGQDEGALDAAEHQEGEEPEDAAVEAAWQAADEAEAAALAAEAAEEPAEEAAEAAEGAEAPEGEDEEREVAASSVAHYRRGERWHESNADGGGSRKGSHGGSSHGHSYSKEASEGSKGGGSKGHSKGSGQERGNVERDKVFVGRLQPAVTENDIWKYFGYYGKVKFVDFKKGFCFVRFESEDAARKVLGDYDKHNIGDQWVETKAYGQFSSTPEPRTPIEKDRIFVGGLDRNTTDTGRIREYFSKYGVVQDLNFIAEKGFAFILFKSGSAVQLALWDHSKHCIDGRWFDVQPCVDKGNKGEGKGKSDYKGDGKGKGDHKGDTYGSKGKSAPSAWVRYDSGGKGSKDSGGWSSSDKGSRSWWEGSKKGELSSRGGPTDTRRPEPLKLPPRAPPKLLPRPPSGGAAPALPPARTVPPRLGAVGGSAGGGPVPPLPGGMPSSWTGATVQRFLKHKGLEEFCGLFTQQEVTGSVLLSLSERDLEGSLGIKKFGPRRQLMLAIEELREKNDAGPPRKGSWKGSGKASSIGGGSSSQANSIVGGQMLRPRMPVGGSQESSRSVRPPPAPRHPGHAASSPAASSYRSYKSGHDSGYSSSKGSGNDNWKDKDNGWRSDNSWSSSSKGKGKGSDWKGKDSWRSRPY